MSRLRVAVTIDVSPDDLWAGLRDISTHTQWMGDADAIFFTSDQTAGVGTTFDCVTRVGPFTLLDHMMITEWEASKRMGVRHSGIITGSGVFRLSGKGRKPTRTKFVWSERLRFPWWLGGPFGSWAATPVMWLIWRRSLHRLRRLVETGQLP